MATALLSACGADSPATPQPDVTVSTSVSSISPPFVRLVDPPGVELDCELWLLTEVQGTGTGVWVDGVTEFSDIRDTSRLLGTIPLSAAEMKRAWSEDTIRGGQSVKSLWHLSGPTAYVATIRMRYQTASGTRTASASARCAPPSGSTAAAPSITSLSVSPSSGSIPVNSPLNVTFTATAPAGAQYSFLRATGGCGNVIVGEFSATTVSHTVPLKLRWPCKTDVPIGVEVITYDAAGYSDGRAVSTSVTIRDDQRPTVLAEFWGREWLDYLPSPYGEYLAPDTVYAQVTVTDDYLVGALYLEVYPFGVADTVVVRDSIVVDPKNVLQPTNVGALFHVPIRREWAGDKLQFRWYGRDWLGNLSNVYTSVSGCVRIVASTVSSPSTPSKPLYDPPCVYEFGDRASARIPSPQPASAAAALLSEPHARSSKSRASSVAGSYGARLIR